MCVRKPWLCTIPLLVGLLSPLVSQAAILIADNFDRADGPVGNGWQNTLGNVGGDLSIIGNRLSSLGESGGAAVYQNMAFTNDVHIQATITDMVANNDRVYRYFSRFSVLASDTFNSGYGIGFARSRDGINNSSVQLYDGSNFLDLKYSTFQFTGPLDVDFYIRTNGAIDGSVSDSLNVYNFSYNARTIISAGNNFQYLQTTQDPRASFQQNATLDNLVVSDNSVASAVPEPATQWLFVLGLLGLLGLLGPRINRAELMKRSIF